MTVWDDWEPVCKRQEFSDLLGEAMWHGWRVRLNLRNVLGAANVRSLKMTQVCAGAHTHTCTWVPVQPKPIKKQRHRQYRCVCLWAQHETQKTASLIITYLSVCPPLGLPVMTADVPHWQARNTHTNSNTVKKEKKKTEEGKKKKKQRRYEYDWCLHLNLSLRTYNHDDQ